MRGVTYVIRSSLYVAVTNRCCTTSLIASRGPGLNMPPSFQPLLDDVEPTAAQVLGEIKRELLGGTEERKRFEEIVFAGVGEPLLQWSVVKEVVSSLRREQANLLRISSSGAASTRSDTDGLFPPPLPPKKQMASRSSTTEHVPPPPPIRTADAGGRIPVKLVTNGLWSAVSPTILPTVTPHVGSFPSGDPKRQVDPRGNQDEGVGANASPIEVNHPGVGREAEDIALLRSGRVAPRRAEDGRAAMLASEVAELFDSISVALNTADPTQYEQLMKPSIEGLPPREAHSHVCAFIRECVARGLPTEVTVVDRDTVDIARARELAEELGACCRVRPYFPSKSIPSR